MNSKTGTIRLTWLGHSCFRLECGGHSAVIDPYREVQGYPPLYTEAGEVFKSHDHDDHGWLEAVRLVEEPGDSPFRVHTEPCFHDEKQGTLRGDNLITIFEAEGLKIAHFGDIGHQPDEELARRLQGLDAALIPVGGFYTIDGREAWELMKTIDPKVTIPMHYRRGPYGFDVISGPEVFTDLVTDRPVVESDGNSIDITADSEKSVVVLRFSGSDHE